jgi:hypothetical protein
MKKGGDGGAGQARADEAARQARIRAGTDSINNTFNSQFTDDYFNSRQQSYLDYATPQLNDQYTDARKQLVFALDRAGLMDSSVRAQREAELQKLYDTNRQQVADKALGYGTQSRNAVEDARSNLISTLTATADADGAAKSAINRAQALSQPDTYSPLGQLFTTFTGTLADQAALEKARSLSSGYSFTPFSLANNRADGSVVNSGR